MAQEDVFKKLDIPLQRIWFVFPSSEIYDGWLPYMTMDKWVSN